MVMGEETVSDDKCRKSQAAIRRKATSQQQQLRTTTIEKHGNYEKAIQVVNHFLSSSSNPFHDLGIDRELAYASFSGLICLGDVHFGLSRYDDAMSCYTSASALQRRILGTPTLARRSHTPADASQNPI
ncbi:hypothetical protein AMTR_s00045p00046420 [Amborella trichopoda]|uniref:Uncharacterized protein n=1 Tax=Amborella trichopoda TaxID=13333 RepID=W1P2X6_AMBTC|nr:hypothetical protein AMTR_s00045p00046420 [Amborella trichopoda]